MAIADEKIKPATRRHVLFDVVCKYNIKNDITQVDGQPAQYQEIILPELLRYVRKLVVSGVTYTAVPDSSLPGTDEFSYNLETRKLILNKTNHSVIADNAFIVFSDLHYTIEQARYYDYTDLYGATFEVEYKPRVKKAPSLSQSVKNVYSGIISFSRYNIQMIDVDNELKDLLSQKISFYNATTKIRYFVNDVLAETMTGKITDLSISNNGLSFGVTDVFNQLKSDALFGDSIEDVTLTTADYPNLDPSLENHIVPYVVGKQSFCETGRASNSSVLSMVDGLQGINIKYNEDQPFENDDFILCRVGPSGVAMQSFGTGAVLTHNLNDDFFTVTLGPGANIVYGDALYIAVDDIFDTDHLYYCICTSLTATTATFTTYDRFTAKKTLTNLAYKIDMSDVDLHYSIQATLIGPDGVVYPLLFADEQPNLQFTTLPSGNKLVKLVGVGGGVWGAYPTTNSKLIFSIQTNESGDHTNLVKRLLDVSGIEYNASNIDGAQSVMDSKCCLQIPSKGSNSVPSNLDVMETILKSTLGFLYTNNLGNITYKLLEQITSTVQDVKDQDINESSWDINVEYQDICNIVEYKNIYYSQSQSLFNDNKTNPYDGSNFNLSDNDSKHLNEIDNTFTVDHCLTNYLGPASEQYYNRYKNLVKNPRNTYSLSVSTILANNTVADEIELNSENCKLGGVSPRDLKVLSLKKSIENIKITATDLEGF